AQQVLPRQFGKWAPGSCPVAQSKQVFSETPVSQEAHRKAIDDEFYCSANLGVRAVAQEFNDPTGAYEFYTSALKVGMNATPIGGARAVNKEQLFTLIGNYVVKIEPPKNISDSDLLLLLKPIKEKALETPLPPIRGYLPNEGMVQGTQRYSMGAAAFRAALESLGQNKFSVLPTEIGFQTGGEQMLESDELRRTRAKQSL